MSVESPKTLLLLALLPGVFFVLRYSLVDSPRVQQILSALVRTAVLVLLALALAGALRIRQTQDAAVLVLGDLSASVPDSAPEQLQRLFGETAAALPGGSEAGLWSFAEETQSVCPLAAAPKLEAPPPLPGARGKTALAQALQRAQASLPADKVRRIVVVSDGNETTGDALSEARHCAARGIAVYTVAYETEEKPEVLLEDLDVPAEVKQGQSFTVGAVAHASQAGPAHFTLYRNGFKIHEADIDLKEGENRLGFDETDPPEGLTRYELRVSSPSDFFADNNVAPGAVSVGGEARVLLLEGEEREGRYLARAMDVEGIQVEVRNARGMPGTLDELAAYDAVIFSGVPATDVSVQQMRLLRTYVEDLGGGFVMLGGENSFGLGGYFRTEVEALLPVKMKAEEQKETPSLAMMLIIDKSGSMNGIKIELAKEAAAAAAELLGARDYVGVVSFDSQPYVIVDLQHAGNTLGIGQAIQSLSAGGGTFIYPALEIALQSLAAVPAAFKHVILLTDGQSQQGDYPGIVARMVDERITVSTVAVGEGADVRLLEDMARWGSGRYYFTADPYDIPQIFTKETMSATKSSLIEEPFLAQVYQARPVTAGINWEEAPFLFGYVVTTPKPTADIALVTEQGDPLYLSWRCGLGKSAAFTSDAKSRWAADWVAWPGYGAFWAQVLRDIMRSGQSGGAETQISVANGRGHVVVDTTDPDGNFVNALVTEAQLISPDLSPATLELAQTAPGRYEGDFAAEDPGSYILKLRQRTAGEETDAAAVADLTRSVTISYNPEFRHLTRNEAFLEDLAKQSGGVYGAAPEDWVRVDSAEALAVRKPLWPALVIAALFLFLADVAARRLDLAGWRIFGKPERYG